MSRSCGINLRIPKRSKVATLICTKYHLYTDVVPENINVDMASMVVPATQVFVKDGQRVTCPK